MEKLWKSYGISFPGICTNPVKLSDVSLGICWGDNLVVEDDIMKPKKLNLMA